jgi:hypothetical protein
MESSMMQDNSYGWNWDNLPPTNYSEYEAFDNEIDAPGQVGLFGEEFWTDIYNESTKTWVPFYRIYYFAWRDVFVSSTFNCWLPNGVEATARTYKHISAPQVFPWVIYDIAGSHYEADTYTFNDFGEGYSENRMYLASSDSELSPGFRDAISIGAGQSTADPGLHDSRPYSYNEIQGYYWNPVLVVEIDNSTRTFY